MKPPGELGVPHLVGAGIVLGGLALIFCGVRSTPRGGLRQPAAVAEDVNFWYEPLARPVVGPDEHVGGVVNTPHRYPRVVGGEISNLIHNGFSTLTLPHEKDMTWLSSPPGEVDL